MHACPRVCVVRACVSRVQQAMAGRGLTEDLTMEVRSRNEPRAFTEGAGAERLFLVRLRV